MTMNSSGVPGVAPAPGGPRYELEPPVVVLDDNPPPVVVRDDVVVSTRVPESRVEHQSGSRGVPMTPYGGSLAAVSSDLGDNW